MRRLLFSILVTIAACTSPLVVLAADAPKRLLREIDLVQVAEMEAAQIGSPPGHDEFLAVQLRECCADRDPGVTHLCPSATTMGLA